MIMTFQSNSTKEPYRLPTPRQAITDFSESLTQVLLDQQISTYILEINKNNPQGHLSKFHIDSKSTCVV